MIDSTRLTGLAHASAVIAANPGKGNKGEKFNKVVNDDGLTIRTFADFFQWKMERIAAKRDGAQSQQETPPEEPPAEEEICPEISNFQPEQLVNILNRCPWDSAERPPVDIFVSREA